MKTTIAIALASAAICLAAVGDTIAWWRFGDLGAEGGKTTADTVFTNTVDASAYTAYPRSFYRQTAPATDPDWMPSTTNAFGEYSTLRVYDPVSGTSRAMVNALSCPWGGDGSGLSGGAVVPVAPELCGITNGVQGDFTFECFFRTTAAGLSRTDKMEPIAGVPSTSTHGSWSILIWNGNITARCTQYKHAGGYGEQISSGVFSVTPDEWHHVAIVYEVSTQTFTVYLDYSSAKTITFDPAIYTGELEYKSGGYLYIGKGTLNNDRSLDGDVAEARFSNAALGPDTFLQLREESNADRESSDPDVIAWFSMDTTDYSPSFLSANTKVRRTGSQSMAGTVVMSAADAVAAVEEETPGFDGVVRGSVYGTYGRAAVVNSASASFFRNTVTNWYFSVSDPSKLIGGGSFTAEAFFKTAHPVAIGGGTSASYGIMNSDAFKIMINQATGYLFMRPTCADGVDRGRDLTSFRVDDGVWRHLALVYDSVSSNLCVYLDYTCVATMSGIEFKSSALGTPVTIGYAPSQKFDGWIDEVRFTARALAPTEFLSASQGVADNMLVRIPLDGDARVLPFGGVGVESPYVKNTNGVALPPESLPEGRAPRVKTGRDNSSVIENNGAYRFEGGMIAFPHVPGIARPNVTIEFFWRPFDTAAPWPSPLGLSGTAQSSVEINTDGIWNFYYRGVWNYAQLMFQFAYTNGTTRTISAQMPVSPSYSVGPTKQDGSLKWADAEYDGKWHHVAATITEYEGDGGEIHTKAVTYFDYKKKSEVDVVGRLYTTSKPGLMMQKSNGTGDRLAKWDLDEVRITGEVLEPEQFCYKAGKGFILLFK